MSEVTRKLLYYGGYGGGYGVGYGYFGLFALLAIAGKTYIKNLKYIFIF